MSDRYPDKVADQISGQVLDAFLARDPDARGACETLLGDQLAVGADEFRTHGQTIIRDIEEESATRRRR